MTIKQIVSWPGFGSEGVQFCCGWLSRGCSLKVIQLSGVFVIVRHCRPQLAPSGCYQRLADC